MKTIVSYCSPHILALEKVAAIPMFLGDNSGTAPAGFADSILRFALDSAFANRYAYCSYTNDAAADNISLLFYDKTKFGFTGIVVTYSNVTDFSTYKLYYKSSGLITGDTIFLYVTLNHTQSGNSSTTRNAQISGEMSQLASIFTALPNMLNMGDFNTHNSSEGCYQTLVSPSNPAFAFSDPPFYPDATYVYPADWDNNPLDFAKNLTTSTRSSSSVPNSCGTSGGGKSWYDHIFLSPPLVSGTMRMRYIPHSYFAVGNDGNRTGISINGLPVNTSAPASVIQAIFQMSNKYPVMASLEVDTSTLVSIVSTRLQSSFAVCYPVHQQLRIRLEGFEKYNTIRVESKDMLGHNISENEVPSADGIIQIPFNGPPGSYILELYNGGSLLGKTLFTK
ncbi:hypothetical protein [Flavipsychrobacter stenotrophus]|nr:hypothetical protein [Flavipsychrobacter stenotrophus]